MRRYLVPLGVLAAGAALLLAEVDTPGRVPGFARIAGITVGRSTIGDLERVLGPGLATLGGHPDGAREWRCLAPPCVIWTDGFDYRHSGGGAFIDALAITADRPEVVILDEIPTTRPPRGALNLWGDLRLGTPRAEVLRALRRRLPAPEVEGETLSWTADGFLQHGNATNAPGGVRTCRNWGLRLTFREGRLAGICLSVQ